jgi:hypothetical protein
MSRDIEKSLNGIIDADDQRTGILKRATSELPKITSKDTISDIKIASRKSKKSKPKIQKKKKDCGCK